MRNPQNLYFDQPDARELRVRGELLCHGHRYLRRGRGSTKSYGEPGIALHSAPCDRISWKVPEYMNGAVGRGSRQNRNRLKTLAEPDAIQKRGSMNEREITQTPAPAIPETFPEKRRFGQPSLTKRFWTFLLGALAALIPICQLDSQVLYSSIVGNVTDATGAAVPGAIVKITHIATNDTREATTNDEGIYTLSTVSAGIYNVAITKQGFRDFATQNVELRLNTAVRVDAQLAVGARSDR
jgi:Carboxypeptidase regulatory-like domain